ncbi:hypothetical protein VTK26DRAFT_9227 [Humicola hyalothermophila]
MRRGAGKDVVYTDRRSAVVLRTGPKRRSFGIGRVLAYAALQLKPPPPPGPRPLELIGADSSVPAPSVPAAGRRAHSSRESRARFKNLSVGRHTFYSRPMLLVYVCLRRRLRPKSDVEFDRVTGAGQLLVWPCGRAPKTFDLRPGRDRHKRYGVCIW